ncbi:MAG: hypothetical protein ACI90R_001611, partial [Alteromonas macleodii]
NSSALNINSLGKRGDVAPLNTFRIVVLPYY